MGKQAGGKKNRKIGRSKRKPSHATLAKRIATNKARRRARQAWLANGRTVSFGKWWLDHRFTYTI